LNCRHITLKYSPAFDVSHCKCEYCNPNFFISTDRRPQLLKDQCLEIPLAVEISYTRGEEKFDSARNISSDLVVQLALVEKHKSSEWIELQKSQAEAGQPLALLPKFFEMLILAAVTRATLLKAAGSPHANKLISKEVSVRMVNSSAANVGIQLDQSLDLREHRDAQISVNITFYSLRELLFSIKRMNSSIFLETVVPASVSIPVADIIERRSLRSTGQWYAALFNLGTLSFPLPPLLSAICSLVLTVFSFHNLIPVFLSFALLSQFSQHEFKQAPVFGAFLSAVHSPAVLSRPEIGRDCLQPILFRLLMLACFFAAERLIDHNIALSDLGRDELVTERYGYGHLLRKVLFYLHKLLLADVAVLGLPLLASAEGRVSQRPLELVLFSLYGGTRASSQAS
jgi:hypothetical protein